MLRSNELSSKTDHQTESHPGRRWRIAGFLLVSLALSLIAKLQAEQQQLDSKSLLILLALALGCFYGGLRCYIRGRKLKALSAEAAMAQDSRPPVLYLRSFKDDAAASVSPIVGFLGMAATVFGISNEEQQLAEVSSDIGPCVAIGKPGEKLPQLGAARMYVSNAEWQERVRELMTRAQLVVLRAGTTEGFWWEVKRAAGMLAPEKLVFLLPFGKKNYNKFRDHAETLLPQRLPSFPGGPSFSLGRLQAMLYFDSDWTAHISKLKARFSVSANPLVPMLKKALEPVAERLHVESRKPSKQLPGYLSRALGTIPGVLLAMWGMTFVFVFLIDFGLALFSAGGAVKHNSLGFALYEKNDIGEAIAEFREAIRLDPALSEAHNNLGLALYAQHDLDGATSEYREALRLSPGFARAHSNLGMALYDRRDLDGAIPEFRAALHLDPGLSEAHNNLGLALYAQHDLDGAISEYREALRLTPDSARVHSNLSLALYDKNDVDAGIEESREAVRLDPQDPWAHNNLGLGLVRKRDLAAFEEFGKAFALAPNDPSIRENYEWTLRQATNS